MYLKSDAIYVLIHFCNIARYIKHLKKRHTHLYVFMNILYKCKVIYYQLMITFSILISYDLDTFMHLSHT